MALWLGMQELVKQNDELRKGLEDGKTQLSSLSKENQELKQRISALESKPALS